MTQVMTSDSHPIRVDFVEREGLPGRLGLTFAPGKRQPHGQSGHWERDLEKDLARLRGEYGADLLVSLIEAHEFKALGIPSLRERAAANGLKVLWFPIADRSVPTPQSAPRFHEAIAEMTGALRAGETVVVHCMGGLGRSGLVAAACLLATLSDLDADEAIRLVRAARAGAVETRGQEEYVAAYARQLRDDEHGGGREVLGEE